MVDNVRIRQEEYDSLSGEWVREVKSNDILNISTAGTVTVAAAGTITPQTVVGANVEAFVTGIVVGATGNSQFYITVNTSTVFAGAVTGSQSLVVTQPDNAPIFRVAANGTINMVAVTGSTFTASLFAKREPSLASLETE